MSSTTTIAQTFLDHVDDDRDWAASRMGLDMLEESGPVALLDELLVPVQQESGRRWQLGAYTVADEHEVTGLVDELLGASSASMDGADGDGLRVTLVCAEGEWHATAARMMTLRLRAEGWDVRFLGASTPPPELEAHLRRRPPAALLVSCTMAAALVGAAAMVEVAHRVGVPVVAGGAAFTVSRSAAAAVGADAVAGGTAEAGAILTSWRRGAVTPSRTRRTGPTAERAALQNSRRRLVQSVVQRTPGPFRPEDEAEVDGVLATLDAALLADDVDVLRHHMAWLGEREAVRQVLPVPLDEVIDLLSRSMPAHLRMSRSYLTTAAGALRTS